MTATTSLTAYVVAASVSRLGARPRWRTLLDQDAWSLADAFRRLAPDAPAKRLIARMPGPLLVGLLEAAFVPGMAYHYLFRKRLIEVEARRLIAGGVRQVVVLGGGFDSLSLRLAKEHPDLTVVEVDLPSNQARKRWTLREIGHEVPPNCHLVAADLAERTLDELVAATPAVRPERATLVVIEGVLMYLKEPEVRALFAALRRLFTRDLSVLYGAIAAPDASGDLRLRVVNYLLSKGDEGTFWYCPADGMPAFLAPLGFRQERCVTYRALQRQYRSPEETRRIPAEDENYYLASRL